MNWHADVESIDRYLGHRLGEAEAASLEAHLLACAACRDALARCERAERAAVMRHERSWERILDGVDQPRLTVLERVLRRCGVPEAPARLVAAAPALRRAWLLAGTMLLAIAVLIAHVGSGTVGAVIFVVTAPVVPLAGVALSYGVRGEPAGEVAVVAPHQYFRLVVMRALVVLAFFLPTAAVLTLALPRFPGPAVLWLVPALALCSLTLAASTFMDPVVAAVMLAVGWLTVAGLTIRWSYRMPAAELLEQSVVFRPASQAVFVGLAVAAVVVAVVRRSAFDTWNTP